MLVCVWNATSLIIFALPPSLGRTMNWVYVGVICATALLVASVREQYLRPANARGVGDEQATVPVPLVPPAASGPDADGCSH